MLKSSSDRKKIYTGEVKIQNHLTIWKETPTYIKPELRKYQILRVRSEENEVEYPYSLNISQSIQYIGKKWNKDYFKNLD